MDLSCTARLLLIAAFLALRSHQRHDKFTFGTASKGRRKRTLNEETDEAEAESVKSFSSERLLRIYSHLSHAHPQKPTTLLPQREAQHTWKGYTAFGPQTAPEQNGGAYHLIATLVRRGLLVEISRAQLLYSTIVTDEMAEMLARSLGIPLQNYMCA